MRVLFVTTHSLATNPRLVKELRSTVALGHTVAVIMFVFDNWSKPINDHLLDEFRGKVEFVSLPGSRQSKGSWLLSTLFYAVSKLMIGTGSRDPYFLSLFANKRSYLLFRSLRKYKKKADLVIAHNTGSFAPAAEYARKNNVKLGLDIEDYHPGETTDQHASQRVVDLMKSTLSQANFITAASPLILKETNDLQSDFKGACTVINNVFSKRQQPAFKHISEQPLKVIWFSQTVGLNRGIQDALRAMNLVKGFSISLTIIGDYSAETRAVLEQILEEGRHSIHFCAPLPEPELIEVCSKHHIGLALEPGFSLNNSLALSNKLFTYILSGNVIVASDTQAQSNFLKSYPNIGSVYPIGDYHALSRIFLSYLTQPQTMDETRKAAYALAEHKLNWEHESQKFIELYQLSENKLTLDPVLINTGT